MYFPFISISKTTVPHSNAVIHELLNSSLAFRRKPQNVQATPDVKTLYMQEKKERYEAQGVLLLIFFSSLFSCPTFHEYPFFVFQHVKFCELQEQWRELLPGTLQPFAMWACQNENGFPPES